MSLIRESAHLLGENPQLMGILSLPPNNTKIRSTAVLILSSGLLHRTGPFRLHVDLARQLASSGFATLRLDQAGRGDSNRSEGLTSRQSAQQEIVTARDFIEGKTSINKLICIGLCSGADDALESTATCEDIMGIIQLDGFATRNWRYYITFYASRLTNPIKLKNIILNRLARLRERMNRAATNSEPELTEIGGLRDFPELTTARASFSKLFARGGTALCVFTGSVDGYYNHYGQLRSNLDLKRNNTLLAELFFPEANHTYPIVTHRENLVEVVANWCDKKFD